MNRDKIMSVATTARPNMFTKENKKIKEGFIGQRMIVLPPNAKKSVSKNELIKRLYLTAIGYYPHAVLHSRERKLGCNQYILLYCINGKGTITIDEKTVNITANQYIILPKNVAHRYTASQQNPWTIYWIHFMGDNADVLYKRYIQNNGEPIFAVYDERRFQEFELVLNLLENSFEIRSLEIANLMLQNFLSHLIYAREINPSQMEHDKISNSITFMKKNIGINYSLQELASQQCISVTHYSRLFRAKTGRSPNQYFSELKIQKSCQYLYFSNLSIKEICLELGFLDQYYFSRLFKKVMGIAPAIYKNQHKKT